MDRTQLEALKEKYFEHVSDCINNWFEFCGMAYCYEQQFSKSKNEPGFNVEKFKKKWGTQEGMLKLIEMHGINKNDEYMKKLEKIVDILNLSFHIDKFCQHIYGYSFDTFKNKMNQKIDLIDDAEASRRKQINSDYVEMINLTLDQENMEYLFEFTKFVCLVQKRITHQQLAINLKKDMEEFFSLGINDECYFIIEANDPIWIHQLIDFYRHFGDLFFEKLKEFKKMAEKKNG